MNSEKLHNNTGLEFTDAQKEALAGMSPEELEKLQAEFQKDIAKRTALAMELEYKNDDGWSAERREKWMDGKDDDEYQHLLDKVSFAKTPSERAKAEEQLRKYQKAREVIAAKEKAEALENGGAQAGAAETTAAEAPKLETELNNLSDEEYEELLEKANMGDAAAQARLAELQSAHAEAAKDAAVEESMNKLDNDVLGPEGVTDLIDNFDADHENNKEYDSFDEFASEPVDGVDGNEFAVEVPEEVKEFLELEKETIERVNNEYEADFEAKLSESKRGNWVKRNLKKVKVALFAFGAFGASILSSLVGHGGTPAVAKTVTGGEGIYNEFTASGLTEKTRNLGNDERAPSADESVTTNSEARLTDDENAGETDESKAEKISSTAKFKIGGKEFTYENMKHEGGYSKGGDSYYDDDKDGEHSMMGPAYEGKWKGTETAFESYEGMMAALKGSPEIASTIAMAAGILGAENIHSPAALNDFADELRNKNPKGFDKFMTEASDYINNFVNGGQMEVSVIPAGEHYQSSFTYGHKDLEIGIDKDVHHDDFDVQIIDFVDADGKSMFNSDEAKARIREMFGLSKKVNFTAGWSARCGQIVIVIVIKTKTISKLEATADLIGVPEFEAEAEIIPDKPDKPEEPEEPGEPEEPNDEETTETPTGTPTEETTTETPVVEVVTPETTPTPEPTPTVTPDVTPTPTLEPKGPDTHAGDNQQQMGTTETNNDDTKVTAEERGNVDPNVAPGAAVPGTNTEGVNTETVNPGGLNQTETTPEPDLSNEASRTENIEHGGDAQSLAERMAAAEAAERNQ